MSTPLHTPNPYIPTLDIPLHTNNRFVSSLGLPPVSWSDMISFPLYPSLVSLVSFLLFYSTSQGPFAILFPPARVQSLSLVE